MEFFHACVYDYIFFFLLCISPFFHVSVYLFADMFAMHLNMCCEPFIESIFRCFCAKRNCTLGNVVYKSALLLFRSGLKSFIGIIVAYDETCY